MVAVVVLAALAASFEPIPYRSRKVEGWLVAKADDDARCFMSLEYEGEGDTSLLLSLEADGSNSLLINNTNWSIKDGEQYKITYTLDSGTYENHTAVGSLSGDYKGFGSKFESKFPDYFASSAWLRLFKDGVVVDRLSLKGSGAAVAELKRCYAIVKANVEGAARDKARFEDIKKDPFASPS